MGLLSLAAYRLSGMVFKGHGAMVVAVNLGVGIVAGTVSVIPLLRLFGVDEIDELSRLVRRKLGWQK